MGKGLYSLYSNTYLTPYYPGALAVLPIHTTMPRAIHCLPFWYFPSSNLPREAHQIPNRPGRRASFLSPWPKSRSVGFLIYPYGTCASANRVVQAEGISSRGHAFRSLWISPDTSRQLTVAANTRPVDVHTRPVAGHTRSSCVAQQLQQPSSRPRARSLGPRLRTTRRWRRPSRLTMCVPNFM